MKTLNYNVIFKSESEGGFTATVPALPGCVSYGKTLVEAKEMITDAIEGYISTLKKYKKPVPTDSNSFMSSVNVSGNKNRVYA